MLCPCVKKMKSLGTNFLGFSRSPHLLIWHRNRLAPKVGMPAVAPASSGVQSASRSCHFGLIQATSAIWARSHPKPTKEIQYSKMKNNGMNESLKISRTFCLATGCRKLSEQIFSGAIVRCFLYVNMLSCGHRFLTLILYQDAEIAIDHLPKVWLGVWFSKLQATVL